MNLLNRAIVSAIPLLPKSFIWLFSKRYIAGIDLQDGVDKARMLNSRACAVTLDLLGEEIDSMQKAEKTMQECLHILQAINGAHLNGSLSLKLTSLGLRVDREACYAMVRDIVDYAKETGLFVRIDMEDATCTDDTLMLYRRLRKHFDNVGTVVQAYLRRTQEDVRQLIGEGIANLRLCKGIYNEESRIALKEKKVIRRNFIELISMMADSGEFTGVATHDEMIIDSTIHVLQTGRINPDRFEFQMLLGVTETRRDNLTSSGYTMRIYVPYGIDWYGYSIRRLKENPQLAGHIMKNLFIRG